MPPGDSTASGQASSGRLTSAERKLEAFLLDARYGFPAEKLKLIGVTGTNGKTSVCHYTTQILGAAGREVGMITTLGVCLDGCSLSADAPRYPYKHLARMTELGREYAVLETTAASLRQDCIFGLSFEAAAFTNLTRDHLDTHGSWERYRQAKEKLFASTTGAVVVNADDPAAGHFLKHAVAEKLTFGILDELRPAEALPNPDVTAHSLHQVGDRTTFHLSTPSGAAEVCVPLFGRHTVANVLAAVALGLSQGVSFSTIGETLSRLRAPEGRLQRVAMGQPYSIFVDFAHNEDGLLQVYRTVRPMVRGRLIAVLGGGGSFPSKQPFMGALAAQYADRVIITTDDPLELDPAATINAVAAGLVQARGAEEPDNGEGTWWWRIEDRREALSRALAMAQPDDTVLVTGRGGEKVMHIGEERIPFDDVAVIQELLLSACRTSPDPICR